MTKVITDICPGCGAKVIWSGIYGNWCAVCMPRDITPSKKKEKK